MKPKKHYGQHFLSQESVLNNILQVIAPSTDDKLIEIGPGYGALTKLLPKSDLAVIEVDVDCVHYLRQKFPGLNVHNIDVLKFNWSAIDHNIRVIGNLPYNIATEIFFACLAAGTKIIDMHFMMQKEVAQRLLATTGSKAYGRLTIMFGLLATVEHLFDISPDSFTPPPKVNSSFCKIVPRTDAWSGPKLQLIDEIVTAAFAKRRKQCHHSLKPWFSKQDLIQLEIDPCWRPENISIDGFKRLTMHQIFDQSPNNL